MFSRFDSCLFRLHHSRGRRGWPGVLWWVAIGLPPRCFFFPMRFECSASYVRAGLLRGEFRTGAYNDSADWPDVESKFFAACRACQISSPTNMEPTAVPCNLFQEGVCKTHDRFTCADAAAAHHLDGAQTQDADIQFLPLCIEKLKFHNT